MSEREDSGFAHREEDISPVVPQAPPEAAPESAVLDFAKLKESIASGEFFTSWLELDEYERLRVHEYLRVVTEAMQKSDPLRLTPQGLRFEGMLSFELDVVAGRRSLRPERRPHYRSLFILKREARRLSSKLDSVLVGWAKQSNQQEQL